MAFRVSFWEIGVVVGSFRIFFTFFLLRFYGVDKVGWRKRGYCSLVLCLGFWVERVGSRYFVCSSFFFVVFFRCGGFRGKGIELGCRVLIECLFGIWLVGKLRFFRVR